MPGDDPSGVILYVLNTVPPPICPEPGERIRAAGCDGYIAKPIRYLDFLATIDAHLVTAPA